MRIIDNLKVEGHTKCHIQYYDFNLDCIASQYNKRSKITIFDIFEICN
jgi:hypothetical protein